MDHLSFLPADSGKFRRYEQLGLRVRSFFNLGIHDKLDPLKLARRVRLIVISLKDVAGLSDDVKRLLGSSSQAWSGGATPELPDGSRIVILNPMQSQGRQAATLMEEVCHSILGHKHSHITLDRDSGENHRDYNGSVEEEAYAVGAAALVPYRALACDLSRGQAIESIANHFGVTRSLIKYRIRVLNLTGYYF
ncbi:MAG: ImmA/IrrE family metallo-endopeptidase [Blastocatellia bacterium]